MELHASSFLCKALEVSLFSLDLAISVNKQLTLNLVNLFKIF